MKRHLYLEFLQDKEQYRHFLLPDNSSSSAKPFYKSILKELITGKLSKRQQEIVRLYYFDQRSMPQIAALLGLNKSTVQRSLVRSRNILKTELQAFLKLYSCYPRNLDSF